MGDGASLIPQYTVSCLLENSNEGSVSATRFTVDHNIYPLLLDCLIHGYEKVATLAMDAIENIAGSPAGIDIVLSANTKEVTHLGALAAQFSSLGWVRVLALIVRLFSISPRANVALVVQKSNLLGLFEAKIKNNDTLSTLSILEALYELSEIEHGREFSTLLQLLSSVISNKSMESILRTGAKAVSGRLLSKENYILADELSVKTVLSAIDRILSSTGTQEIDECEPALEALGQIQSSIQGAQFLLSSYPPAARHVIYTAFDRQGRGK
ncbi:uncharacterized protein [Malus domestica]|uniref:uncharacterized protein isoform X2 n=1 Tax=Malus domestica TaxID=3750 RepID=UPI003976198D